MSRIDRPTVLYIGAFQLPDKNAAAHRVIANGKLLRELGYNVVYIGFDEQGEEEDLCKTKSEWQGFVYYKAKLPVGLSGQLKYLGSISGVEKVISRELNTPPQIIIAYNYPFWALYRLKKFSRQNDIRLLADCTEWYDNPQGNIVYRAIKKVDMYFRIHRIQPRLDGVIVISKYLKNYYLSKGSRVLLLPPLIDSKEEKWFRRNDDVESDVSGRLRLVYAGSPGRGNKDRLDRVLEALYEIKLTGIQGFHLYIIGLTEKEFLQWFQVDVPVEEIRRFTSFRGRMSHQDSLEEIKRADYFIFLREQTLGNTAGFPTKFVEAFGCATPVLTNLTSDLGDFLFNGKNGYRLVSETKGKLVNSIEQALSQKKEKIKEMKKDMQNDGVFDYRNYTFVSRFFFSRDAAE